MKIVTVLGARPQFVKAATISRAISVYNSTTKEKIIEKIIHTGQHYDANMSDVFFDEMNIPKPDYNLGIGGSSHGAMTGQQLELIEKILLREKPDFVLVYGDTNSTLAGALAGVKIHIPIVHVEAGLRSFNMKMPEEINRILTDNMSSILFCPTATAMDNLENDGFLKRECSIYNVGDVMYDAAAYYSDKSTRPSEISENTKKYGLLTIHRAENTNNLTKLKNIASAINEISIEQEIICPIHPRTKKIIEANEIKINATFLNPVSYFEMLWLIKNTNIILTDSGGLQKEAYFFNKPCITLRDQTEWVELVDLKVNILVGSSKKEIIKAYDFFSKTKINCEKNIYGDGNASTKILELMLGFLNKKIEDSKT